MARDGIRVVFLAAHHAPAGSQNQATFRQKDNKKLRFNVLWLAIGFGLAHG